VAAAANATATLDKYGRGERHAGVQDPTALSNCDPFLGSSPYTEPKYDPFWYCANPPDWDNVRCVSTGDIRRDIASSVGMIVHADGATVSTCSVTLIEPDLVVTAGHCVTNLVEDAASGSIIFGYQTECNGSRPSGYAPLVVKCKEVVRQRNSLGHDYCLMRLVVPPGGLGLPLRQLRHDLPALGEQVFGLHHPNGAVMKLSPPKATGMSTVTGSSALSVTVASGFDVSGGSSGSALFDTAGRVVGMLSHGAPCQGSPLVYYPAASMLADIAAPPPPPVQRDVVLVLDRSGSMSLPGLSGRPKMAEAADAASLFVQLVRAGTGSKVGLVSFSTTSSQPPDVALAPVTSTLKSQLVGPAPYVAGAVGALTPGGSTSIGAGLDTARAMLAVADGQPHGILLLTDGLQNTPPMISAVEAALGGIDLHAIGYGTPGSLDGALLSALASAHNGAYARADSSLRLEKFFAQAFGAIFESGLLTDPEFDLPQDQQNGPQMPFDVCGEEAVTVVLGWDDPGVALDLAVTTPAGTLVSPTGAGVIADAGRSWRFFRVSLPYGAERDGQWSATAYRPGGGGELGGGGPAVRYFLSVVASGGPRLSREPQPVRYYTGDIVNPVVRLGYDDGGGPEDATVQITVTGPDASVGSYLTAQGLAAPVAVDGDAVPGRQATVLAAENAGTPPIRQVAKLTTGLSGEPGDLRGAFEAGGRYGKELPDLLTVDGDYTVHAVATYGSACVARRELLFSWHVDVGIDSASTVLVVTESGQSGGTSSGTVTLTPQDRYGNKVGPGSSGGLTVFGGVGTVVSGPPLDNGDGSYSVPVSWPTGDQPAVVVGQPDRPPVVLAPPAPGGGGPTAPWGCLPWLLLAVALVVILVLVLLILP
jgi:hypothetical protein